MRKPPLQLDKQLRVLQVEYLDLYMLHGPHEEDPELEMEAWKALEDAQRAGKVRSIGVSNFEAWQLEHLLGYASIKPATVQNKFDVFAPLALRCFSARCSCWHWGCSYCNHTKMCLLQCCRWILSFLRVYLHTLAQGSMSEPVDYPSVIVVTGQETQ